MNNLDDTSTTPPDPKFLPVEFIELTERRGDQRFWKVAELRHADGVLIEITERATDGKMSFGVFREFELAGKTQKSMFLAARHIQALVQMLPTIERRMEQMEDRARAARRIAAG